MREAVYAERAVVWIEFGDGHAFVPRPLHVGHDVADGGACGAEGVQVSEEDGLC